MSRLLLLMLLLAGCAQGYGSEPQNIIAPPSEPEPPAFTGEACALGERVLCLCEGGGEGVRACVASDASPTRGALSECVSCSSPPSAGAAARTGSMSSAQTTTSTAAGRGAIAGQSGAGPSAAGRGIAGAGGQSGGGSSSTASASTSAGRAGAAATAGASGARSTAGSGGMSIATGGAGGSRAGSGSAAGSGGRSTTSARCECTQSCFLLGIFPCCRTNGSCGCSWAPGAYCM